MIQAFIRSFLLPWTSILLIFRNGKLFLYSLIPWVFNVVIFAGLLFLYGYSGKSLAERISSSLGDAWWAEVLAWLTGILLFLGLTALQVLLFTYIAMLLSGVFGEQLSFHTEHHLRGSANPSPEGNMIKIFIRSVVEELKGMLFFALGFLLLLLLNFIIPVIGSAMFAVAAPLWTAYSLAFEFTAPTTERRGLHFREKRRFIFKHPAAALGFGLGILPMSLIPIVNFTFIPFAIVGGTRWFLMHEETEASR
ncbi:MAG TPA: EI24 domain-containing protein [bacterium]|nr:EI24 domain-containing protein [bacterium]